MKLLHTSDFHIGKRLYDYELIEDHQLFFNWLIQVIKDNEVDYLLVTGDIFDQSNPSQESLKTYYSLLADLTRLKCKVIITAGNHDSPALIDAPANILDALDICVVGTAHQEAKDVIIPLYHKSGKVVAAALAVVPFLRDRDIRKAGEAVSYDSRIEAVREGIAGYYRDVAEEMDKRYPGIPHIASGHLFVQGVTVSPSEREIQIGNQAGISEASLSGVDYFLLGHMHKAQDVEGTACIRYCGTPIPLSFAEKDYEHKVILINVEEGVVKEEDIEIPRQRKLEVLEGSVAELTVSLQKLENPCSLPLLADVTVVEENYTPEAMLFRETLAEEFSRDGELLIIQSRIRFLSKGASSVAHESHLEEFQEITPEKVFDDVFQSYDKNERIRLKEMFLEIKQDAEEEEDAL